MRVAYFIFSNEHGTGGHHHSLKTISNSLQENNDVIIERHIVNLGIAPSPVLDSMLNYKFYKINELTMLFNIFKIIWYCHKSKIELLHAFDANAYFYVRIISFILGIPSLYTKCGGSNIKYNPKVNIATTFSGENYDFLSSRHRHRHLFLIENRVASFDQDSEMIQKLRKKFKTDNKTVFLRVIRISNYYKSSILSTIDFVSNFPNSVLVLVGSIYDSSLQERILLSAKENDVRIILLSSKEYTKDAKRIIDFGDVILGTGRAAMEAMSTGKMLLSFVKNLDYPVIVDKDNLEDFKYYNFSERVKLSKIPSKKFIVNNVRVNDKQANGLSEEFVKYYLVGTRSKEYIDIYNKSICYENINLNIADFIINFFYHLLRASNVYKMAMRLRGKLFS